MATFNGRLRQLMKEKDFTQHKLAKRTFFDGKELIVRKETSVFDYAIEEDGLLISSKILNVRTQPLSGYVKKWKEVIAPAGHGKTEMIAEIVQYAKGKQLLLTHVKIL